MAATLPAINSAGLGNRNKSPVINQVRMSSGKSKGASSVTTIFIGHPKKHGQSKKEWEIEQKKLALRAQQPLLQKWQTTQYRNTYKHNMCLDMLQDGFHQSFTTLFQLIKQQHEKRMHAGPESALWNQSVLENEPEKLEMLKAYLTKAEEAERIDNFKEMYSCQLKLAQYFQETGDKWLSDFFFDLCLSTSTSVKTDGGKLASSAHCSVGLALEESGDYFDAATKFEQCHRLLLGNYDWSSPSDFEACNHLCRIYTTIANKFEASRDLKQYLDYIKKAYDMAKEGGDKATLGVASYRLGIAYEKNLDAETALQYLNGYLDICQVLNDFIGTGKACEAIAKAYESQGKVEKSIKYLEMFVEVAERSKDDKAISRACSDLGAMFNSLGRYEQAVEYFNKAYNIARAMNDTECISSSRVLFGVAAAHKMLFGITKHINNGTRQCVERLIEWKDNRGDEFDKEITDLEENEQN